MRGEGIKLGGNIKENMEMDRNSKNRRLVSQNGCRSVGCNFPYYFRIVHHNLLDLVLSLMPTYKKTKILCCEFYFD